MSQGLGDRGEGMSTRRCQGRACPKGRQGMDSSPPKQTPDRPRAGRRLRGLHPRGAAGRGRGDFLGCHDEGECDDDVGAAGADGAQAVGALNEFAKRIREAAVDPVADHNARAERCAGKELLG